MASRTIITTLVTEASEPTGGGAAYDLTDLATVKSELNITNGDTDALLRGYISRASAAAASYCNRVFPVETITDEIWTHRDPTPGRIVGKFEPLTLSRFPVTSVTSVVENSITLVDRTDFRVDYDKGQLIRLGTAGVPTLWPVTLIAATYAAGYETIPGDVVDAVIRMVKNRWFMRGRDASLRQQNVPGVLEQTFWVATGAEAGAMTPDVVDLLDGYRVPVIA
jgi:hypothetical protein